MNRLANRLTTKLAGSSPLGRSYHIDHLSTVLPEMVSEAVELVVAETGLAMTGHPEVQVLSRPEWVERNVAATIHMLEPALAEIEADLRDRKRSKPVPKISPNGVWGWQLRLVLSLLSRRVLGQYELVLPEEPSGDSMIFVGENLLSIERSQMFRPAEFRMWVALHECTHRAQFEGVSWLRPYFIELINQLILTSAHIRGTKPQSEGQPDVEIATEPQSLAAKTVEEANTQDQPASVSTSQTATATVTKKTSDVPSGLWERFASEPQKKLISKIQALMSLLEGHGHVVMDRVGEKILHTSQPMSARLKMRRQKAGSALLYRLTGLDMKLAQYEMGERFVLEVEKLASWETLDQAWVEPSTLPTLAEIQTPKEWLARIG